MLVFAILFSYISVVLIIFAFMPRKSTARPTLEGMGFGPEDQFKRRKESALTGLAKKINASLAKKKKGRELSQKLSIAYVNTSVEEFYLIKQILVVAALFINFMIVPEQYQLSLGLFLPVFAFFYPNMWLNGKVKKVKEEFVRLLPDAVDLLGLCVNAGLDFMLSLKWVVEKSPPSVVVDQLNMVLQEINVGKTRRDSLRDLAQRYQLRDLSTFTRTLIQADKMGTSMSEALNSLSIDMRYARYRRGEQIALKAPMKLLFPLLVFIFPVVGILIAGPIFIDFMEQNPLKGFNPNVEVEEPVQ